MPAITQDGEFYGYSLALGSAEVSLWEQVNAYRTLARGGIGSPLRLRSDDPVAAPSRILAADASYLVTDILSDRAARVATFGLDNNLNTAFWSAVKDRHQQGPARQLVYRLLGPLHGRRLGRQFRRRLDARRQRRHRCRARVARHHRRAARTARFARAVAAARRTQFAVTFDTGRRAAAARMVRVGHRTRDGRNRAGARNARHTSRAPATASSSRSIPTFRRDRQRVPAARARRNAAVGVSPRRRLARVAPRSHVLWPPSAGAHRLALVDRIRRRRRSGAVHGSLARLLVTSSRRRSLQ